MVLGLMARNNVVPNPLNYCVWYEYVSGNNEPLKQAMGKLLDESGPITSRDHQQLYRQYILDGGRMENRKILQEIQRVLDEVSQHVKSANGDVSQQGGKLENLVEKLGQRDELSAIRSVVDYIIGSTRQIINSSSRLETQLMKTTDEVGVLREKLTRLKAQAMTDALTGLVNRWGLDKLLRREMNTAMETEKELCIIMADIDHFKEINDTYGHLVGDNVIKMFASTLADFVKGRDLVVRYGGEEFLIILPETILSDAVVLAGKMQTFLETMKWRRKGTGKTLGKITLSFGVARYRHNESMEDFIHRADTALYHSKQNGRNRVTTEDALQPAEIN